MHMQQCETADCVARHVAISAENSAGYRICRAERLCATRSSATQRNQSSQAIARLSADIAFCGSEAKTAGPMDDFTWKQVYASWNQGSRSLQGMTLQGETVKQLQLLLALLRLL